MSKIIKEMYKMTRSILKRILNNPQQQLFKQSLHCGPKHSGKLSFGAIAGGIRLPFSSWSP